MATTAAAAVRMSVEEYLRSSFEPDAEFVDGAIEQRPAAEDEHCAWQAAIVGFFVPRAREWNIRVRPELRTRASERRYRVPDVAILDADLPRAPISTAPPLVVFEILSPEDRIARLLVRLADFESMGVGAIYIIDPADGSLLRYRQGVLKVEDAVLLLEKVIPLKEFTDLLW